MILEDRAFKTAREAVACYQSIERALGLCGEPEEVTTTRNEFKQEIEAFKEYDRSRQHLGVQPLSELIDELFNDRINQLKETNHDTY